jgi:hypothetical protein
MSTANGGSPTRLGAPIERRNEVKAGLEADQILGRFYVDDEGFV